MTTSDTDLGSNATAATAPQTDQTVTGRSVFLVETVAAGVSVRPVFLTEDQRLLDMPAVFPDMAYAMAQIDDLRRAVAQHFAQAAQVGAQVIAAQAAANASAAAAATSEDPPSTDALASDEASPKKAAHSV